MRAICTLIWDSFRMLSARKLFWFAMAITLLISVGFASVGFNDSGYSLGFGLYQVDDQLINSGSPLAEVMLLKLLTDVVVPWWFGLAALVLALISTCSIFPEFMTSGSIDIALSKPVRRTTIFFTKYLCGLLFVAVQVACFCLVIFLALGLRLENWNYTIFWAVPLIVFVYSLIYSVAVLVGVWSRSTIFALLMAIGFWGFSWLIQVSEGMSYKFAYTMPEQGISINYQSGETVINEGATEPNKTAVNIHSAIEKIALPLPKTRDATYLIRRKITVNSNNLTSAAILGQLANTAEDDKMFKSEEKYQNRHSERYIILSSLAFEALVLLLASWLFCRRDY